MINYSPPLPVGKDGNIKQNYVPPITAKAVVTSENASASSIQYLNVNAGEVEVAAVNQHVAIKWMTQSLIDSSVAGTSVITAVGSGNWDGLVQKDTVRRFVIPMASAGVTSISSLSVQNGLYPAIAYKTFAGNGSVLLGQY